MKGHSLDSIDEDSSTTEPKHKLRYCLVDSETGLTFHNYHSEEQARESMARMSGNYHIAQEILDENNMPVEVSDDT